MKFISKDEFHRQFGSHGISLDGRYDPPQTFVFKEKPDWRYSWEMPTSIKDLPHWINCLIDATHPEKKTYLYPRNGAWASGDSVKLFLMSAIFAIYGLKPSGDEVIEVENSERNAIESLIFLTLVHGATVSDDISVIPDNGKVVLLASHHEAIHGRVCG